MGYIKFLQEKTKGYSIKSLLRLELESLIFGILGLIPTTFGVLLRGLAAKFFFKECKGLSWMQPNVIIVHTDKLSVGSNLGINSGSYLNAVGGIEIGNYVLIGSNVTISSGMHPIEGCTPAIFERQTIPKKIIIEDDVWIGAGAVIMPGIKLAKGTVVGANSTVTKDTMPYSIVVGSPAKVIKQRL